MHLLSWDSLRALAALLTFAGTLELIIVSIGTVLGSLRKAGLGGNAARTFQGQIIVVVPAHNEAAGIAQTLRSLQAANPAAAGASVVVIADNCLDNTAELARAEGVRVLERQSDTQKGKGYALDFAFRQLMPEQPAAFIVVDADASVEAGFFEAFRAGFAHADALQCAYLLSGGGTRRELMQELAFSCFNFSRPLARERLGISCGILGNGFGLRAELLQTVPYTAASIVEDLEYHLRLVQAGKRVRFLPDTVLRSPMPSRPEAVRNQRVRWEGGRLGIAYRFAPGLAADVALGNWRLLEPLLDLLLLPLGFHAIVLGTGLVTAMLGSDQGLLRAASDWALWLGVWALICHVGTAFLSPHIGRQHAVALREAPAYLLWKLKSIGAIVSGSRSNAAWVRTEREQKPPRDDAL